MSRRHKILMVLTLVASLVGASLAVGRGGEPAFSAAPPPVYDIKVVHADKTITITVKLAFYVRPALEPNDPRRKPLTDAVERIRADIAKFWANQYFVCYKVVINPVLRLVIAESEVRTDEVGILLDPALVPVKNKDGALRAHGARVAATGGGKVLSENPDDRVNPSTGPPPTGDDGQKIDSSWPVNGVPGVYSHELGHVLGLDDNYDRSREQDGVAPTAEGAADDMMRMEGQPLHPTTITRLIRRSGKVDEKSLKCSVRADMPVTMIVGLPGLEGEIGLHMYACKLNPPSNAPGLTAKPIEFVGAFSGNGAISTPFGGGSGGGLIPVTTKVMPGDPSFTALVENGTGRIELDQAITWVSGMPLAEFTNAVLTKVLPIDGRVVFTPDAEECK